MSLFLHWAGPVIQAWLEESKIDNRASGCPVSIVSRTRVEMRGDAFVRWLSISAWLDHQANCCSFLTFDIYGCKFRYAYNVKPVFLQVPTCDGDCFDGLIDGSCTYRLNICAIVLSNDTSNCTGYSRCT